MFLGLWKINRESWNFQFKCSLGSCSYYLTCCVLHNYCEMWKILKPNNVNDTTRKDNLVGFRGDRLPTLKDGEHAKQEGESMRTKIFEQWLLDHAKV